MTQHLVHGLPLTKVVSRATETLRKARTSSWEAFKAMCSCLQSPHAFPRTQVPWEREEQLCWWIAWCAKPRTRGVRLKETPSRPGEAGSVCFPGASRLESEREVLPSSGCVAAVLWIL